jgi:hypothetical protein
MDLGYLGTFINVTQESADPQDGTYNVKLESKDPGTGVMVGLVTLGDLDIINQTITGGQAYTERPDQLTGYYKFSPVGQDTALVGVAFYNGADTIAMESFEITQATSTWTPFTIDINYASGASPDTMNIICITSIKDTAVAGTVLEIDNLQFLGGTLSAPQPFIAENINISPNPANTYVNIKASDLSENSEIIIHNPVGQVIYSETVNSNSISKRIDVSKYEKGIYFVEIKSGERNVIKKLVIK